MYGFYKPLEAALAPWKSFVWSESESASAGREKTPLLMRDLCALSAGDALEAIPLCPETPRLETLAQALGCLYVLEGATLGGQIIGRHLQTVHGIGPDNGAAFFGGYGPETGRRWKDFGQVITRHAEREDCPAEQIIAAARETFSRYEAWVGPAADTVPSTEEGKTSDGG